MDTTATIVVSYPCCSEICIAPICSPCTDGILGWVALHPSARLVFEEGIVASLFVAHDGRIFVRHSNISFGLVRIIERRVFDDDDVSFATFVVRYDRSH